jgi:hypothetical protein
MAQRNPLAEVPPDEFVQARNALVKQLRGQGQAEEARRVAALRRPSAVLFIVNQLGRRAAGAVADLIESTRRAKRAQVEGRSGDELREAMHAQREATQRLLTESEQMGIALTPEQKRRLQDTVQTAAASQPDALKEGSLEQELSASGFDALLTGPAAVVARATARKRTFETGVEERKRQAEGKREQALRQREIRQAEVVARQLAHKADQLDHHAQQAKAAADHAKAQSEEARRAANEAAERLARLQSKA